MVLYVACNSRINFLVGSVSRFAFMKYLFIDLVPAARTIGVHRHTYIHFIDYHAVIYRKFFVVLRVPNRTRI